MEGTNGLRDLEEGDEQRGLQATGMLSDIIAAVLHALKRNTVIKGRVFRRGVYLDLHIRYRHAFDKMSNSCCDKESSAALQYFIPCSSQWGV